MTKIFKGEKIQYNQEKTKRKTKVRLYERTVECKWERDERQERGYAQERGVAKERRVKDALTGNSR